MDDVNGYIVAEFNDGLQLIPGKWYNAEKQSSIWPSHFKTQFRINKAIITKEMPTIISDWEQLPIKRIFGTAGTYTEAMEKLVRAQDTSNIEDDTDISPNELKERNKKRRRIKAKKQIDTYSTSSSNEDVAVSEEKENSLPTFPKINQFVHNQEIGQQSLMNKHTNNSKNTLTEKTSITSYKKGLLAESSTVNIEDPADAEFKKQVLLKLNKILYKLDTLENKVDIVDNKIEFSNPINKESNIEFPIPSIAELTYFEEQLQEIEFKNEVLNIFKLVGGSTAHIMIHNILKKAVTNSVAINFSWAGKRNKKAFKDLNLAKIIAQAVRMLHGQVTDNDITDSISKWLAQATLRTQREKSDQTK